MKRNSQELSLFVLEITEVEDKTSMFLACSLQCAQMAIFYSVYHTDHSFTILLPQEVKFL